MKRWYTMYIGLTIARFNVHFYRYHLDEIKEDERENPKVSCQLGLLDPNQKARSFMMYTLITMINKRRIDFGVEGARSIEYANTRSNNAF